MSFFYVVDFIKKLILVGVFLSFYVGVWILLVWKLDMFYMNLSLDGYVKDDSNDNNINK